MCVLCVCGHTHTQVGIVLCPFIALPDAHDIAEALQIKIESMPCFVHLGM